MCIAKKADFASTNGDGFYHNIYIYHYAVLYVGSGGNIRRQPWEPSINGTEDSFEEDGCTMSDLFCKHNKTALNTTSTTFAGQVETGKPAVDLAASADERSLAAGLMEANLTAARSSGSGGWKADGTWSASAGTINFARAATSSAGAGRVVARPRVRRGIVALSEQPQQHWHDQLRLWPGRRLALEDGHERHADV